MSIKHVKDYYLKTEDMYIELLAGLKEMEDEFKKGECTEEELNNLLEPVNNIKENYQRLAYVMYLLAQPNRDKKKAKYDKQNRYLVSEFNRLGISQDIELDESKDALKQFKKNLKERFKKDE